MASVGVEPRVDRPPRWTQPWAICTAGLVVGASLIWTIAVTLASADLQSKFDSRLASAGAGYERSLDRIRRDSLRQTAVAVGASLEPTMALKGQAPEISDRTLQRVVTNLLASQRYSFVAILDNQGTVLASSDLALVGRAAPRAPSNAVSAKIGSSPSLGLVILAPR